jgi:organic radical activating enzyme
MKNKKNIPGMVEWVITDGCNYRCSYCSVDNYVKTVGYNMKNSDLFIKQFIKYIPKGWNFRIIGGEPFSHPNFLDVVSKLIKAGYTISVFTNLSAPTNQLKKFLKITGEQLLFFKTSFHFEYNDPDIFIKKINNLRKSFFDFERVSVYSVALPEKLDYLEKVSKKFKKAGMPSFKLLFLRDKKKRFYKYTKKQKNIINRININSSVNREEVIDFKKEANMKGKMCDCGYKYIFLYPDGKAFRCISSTSSKKGYLGNILKNDFSLYKKPSICQEKSCYCLGRRMINQFQKIYE